MSAKIRPIINFPAKTFQTDSVYVILSPYIYYAEAAAEHRSMEQLLCANKLSVNIISNSDEIYQTSIEEKKEILRRPKSVARELIPCRHFEPARVKPN